jgi:4-amino-4-deoxy-L-arabinose transferase-like glycosyltransferase
LGRRLLRAFAVLLIGGAAWVLSVDNTPGGSIWLERWWQWNIQQFLWASDNPVWGLNIKSGLKASAWFFWPTWPLALWAVWHYRHALKEPALRVPLAALVGLWLGLLCTKGNQESDFFPLIVPLALLAALGLPTLRKALISLIDWFAVTSFTAASILIWLGWTAVTFGSPEKIAYNFNRLAPGFNSVIVPMEVFTAVVATLAWLLLVVWRVKTHPRALWRVMVLSTGGTTLVWLLLMTLWLPWINHGKTYKYVADHLHTYTKKDDGCIATRSLGLAQRASLVYHAKLNVRLDAYLRKNLRADECSWLLIQTSPHSNVEIVNPSKWEKVWEGGRSSDKDEKFILYKHTYVGSTEIIRKE